MKIKTLVVNAIVAALYVAVTAAIAPIGFYALQFRISEIFNHLIVFNKKNTSSASFSAFSSQICYFHQWSLLT